METIEEREVIKIIEIKYPCIKVEFDDRVQKTIDFTQIIKKHINIAPDLEKEFNSVYVDKFGSLTWSKVSTGKFLDEDSFFSICSDTLYLEEDKPC